MSHGGDLGFLQEVILCHKCFFTNPNSAMFISLLQIESLTQQSISGISAIKDWAIGYAPKIVGAILFYIIGSWLIGKVTSMLRNVFTRRHYDASLQTFLLSAIRVVVLVVLLISIAGILGVDTTAFGALLVGAGVAIGSALNGSLGNFAGGVMMLIFKPFKVGDMIEAQGQTGKVTEQGVFNTVLVSAEHKTVILPNGPLSTGVIVNYNATGFLRVDITMAIAPDTDIAKAKAVAIAAMMQNDKVLSAPAPEANVLKIADGMITLALRPYTAPENYWNVFFSTQELVKEAFDKNGIAGPVPHRIIVQK